MPDLRALIARCRDGEGGGAMSYIITTDVGCDGDDCAEWTTGVAGRVIDRKGATSNAMAAGWSQFRGKHFCPKCRAKAVAELREAMEREVGRG